MNFLESYQFLAHHPFFMQEHVAGEPYRYYFLRCLDIDVEEINSSIRIHLKCGRYAYGYDKDLEVYGKSFEKAIIELAEKVKKKYGEYK